MSLLSKIAIDFIIVSFDKEGMNSPIQITRVDNGRCKPYTKVPKGGNRCHWAKQNGYTHIEAYWL